MAKGKATKPAVSKDDWATPRSLIKFIRRYFNVRFGIDAAATKENSVAPQFYKDALNVDWSKRKDKVHWLNPPFSQKDLFLEKVYLEYCKGVTIWMLLPASTGALWFKKAVNHAKAVYLITGRLTFVGAPSTADFDCCLMQFGGFDVDWKGIRMLDVPKEYRKDA